MKVRQKCPSQSGIASSRPRPFFAVSLGSAQCSGWDRGYLRLWHCHLASGSTCVPEVLILILNRLDTKTNKLSSLRERARKITGTGRDMQLQQLICSHQSYAHYRHPPATLDFKYWGCTESLCAGSARMCDWMRVWRGVLEEVSPPHSCRKVRQQRGN